MPWKNFSLVSSSQTPYAQLTSIVDEEIEAVRASLDLKGSLSDGLKSGEV